MLGFILYETVDLGVNMLKLTYKGARGAYYWWYDLEYPEVVESQRKEETMEALIKKIDNLEKIIKEKQLLENKYSSNNSDKKINNTTLQSN